MNDLGGHDDIVEEAIGWKLALRDGALPPEEQAEFESWLSADERHRRVWQKLEGSLDAFKKIKQSQLSGYDLVENLQKERASRRTFLRRSVTAVAVGSLGLGITDRVTPLAAFGADFSTPTGQRRLYSLADGSKLALNARSSVDQISDAGRRGVVLHEGTIIAKVTPGPKPFQIAAGALSVHVREGRVLVANTAKRLHAIALDTNTVHLMAGNSERDVAAGAGYRWEDGSLSAMLPSETMDAGAWLDGKLIVHDHTLGEVVAALRPYKRGILSISDRAAALRVSGVFGLDQPVGTLAMIGRLYPVSVLEVGPFYSRVDLVG
ncbi:transmembrane sensor [Rhizomicrobium palustre]|uniref:Transmembrane sensor n=1 Tax=Rhizomicrobium palustre TaxID=189966 RepID=A0A846MZZ4_9PROT|nr:FecR domain-containing protein [Rhizomicrobium palustre]NIK88507.1 transmembrane sensor [Rhizomicrobium palustre]